MALKLLDQNENAFCFTWKIKHFSLLSYLTDSSIISPNFKIKEMDNTNWYLDLQTHVTDNGYGYFFDVTVLKMFLKEEDGDPEEIKLDIKSSLFKMNYEEVIEEKKNLSFRKGCYSNQNRIAVAVYEEETEFVPEDTMTVVCFIKKHSINMSTSVKCSAYTDILVEKNLFAFPFEIPSRSSVFQQQQAITIPINSVSKKYTDFEIVLEYNDSSLNTDPMTVEIKMGVSDIDVWCNCKLSVKDTKNKMVFLYKGYHKFRALKWSSWTLRNDVPSCKANLESSKESSFLLRCMIVVSDGTESSYIGDLVYSIPSSQVKQLGFLKDGKTHSNMQKLKCLYEDNRLCDFTLQVDGGEEFRIHKAVLGAVSPVFCAMFELEMKEKENAVSIIKDIDANTMQKLINFAYTGSVEDLQWESALKLYIAADRYQIAELKQCCANWIIANFSIENVTEILTLSDMYQDNNLELAAGNFVFLNAREVFRSENWKTFIESKVTVANKIMQKI